MSLKFFIFGAIEFSMNREAQPSLCFGSFSPASTAIVQAGQMKSRMNSVKALTAVPGKQKSPGHPPNRQVHTFCAYPDRPAHLLPVRKDREQAAHG